MPRPPRNPVQAYFSFREAMSEIFAGRPKVLARGRRWRDFGDGDPEPSDTIDWAAFGQPATTTCPMRRHLKLIAAFGLR